MVYKIPCSWEIYALATVEADSIEEAIEIAERDDFPLPHNGDYVEGSFFVDREIANELN